MLTHQTTSMVQVHTSKLRGKLGYTIGIGLAQEVANS